MALYIFLLLIWIAIFSSLVQLKFFSSASQSLLLLNRPELIRFGFQYSPLSVTSILEMTSLSTVQFYLLVISKMNYKWTHSVLSKPRANSPLPFLSLFFLLKYLNTLYIWGKHLQCSYRQLIFKLLTMCLLKIGYIIFCIILKYSLAVLVN